MQINHCHQSLSSIFPQNQGDFSLFKVIGRGAAHVSRSSPYLELSISGQPIPLEYNHVTFIT